MTDSTYARYLPSIKKFLGDPCASNLLMAQDGPLAVYYAPFEWVNPDARVVLVGISPGRTQATNALAEAQRAVLEGAAEEEVLRRARRTGAFSGAMRSNLASLLDSVGLHSWLGLTTSNDLFGASAAMLQTTSVLQFPVFLNGENYNGSPDPTKHPLLREMVLKHFVRLHSRLSDAVFLPLGPVPTKVMTWLAAEGGLARDRVLEGLPHPSGANAERIKYFLGQKLRGDLSSKTDPDKLDAAKAKLIQAVASLPKTT